MNDKMTHPPRDWEVLTFSYDWDPTNPQGPVRITRGSQFRLPQAFFLAIQTPAMQAEDEPTWIFIHYRATDEDEVLTHSISGQGKWLAHLSQVTTTFPPTAWAKHAVLSAAMYMVEPEGRPTVETAKVKEAALPLQVITAPVGAGARRRPLEGYLEEPGIQRRRKITPEHLQEVAKVYVEAQENDDPPTRSVQQHFNVSHSTAAKWVGQARKGGMLPPAKE